MPDRFPVPKHSPPTAKDRIKVHFTDFVLCILSVIVGILVTLHNIDAYEGYVPALSGEHVVTEVFMGIFLIIGGVVAGHTIAHNFVKAATVWLWQRNGNGLLAFGWLGYGCLAIEYNPNRIVPWLSAFFISIAFFGRTWHAFHYTPRLRKLCLLRKGRNA